MSSGFNIFIGIPAYNSASSFPQVIDEIRRNPEIRQIILVDDASTDSTRQVMSENKFESIHRFRNEMNRGYGGTVKRIFTEFRALSSNPDDLIIILHSDGQTPPDEIPLFADAYEKTHADMILGSRMLAGFRAQSGNRPLFKIIGDYILTGIQNLAYGLSVSSYASGYRAFRRGALDVLGYGACDNLHNFDTEIILEAKRAGLKISEIPVRTVKSKQISNNALFGYAMRSVKTFFKYKFAKAQTKTRCCSGSKAGEKV